MSIKTNFLIGYLLTSLLFLVLGIIILLGFLQIDSKVKEINQNQIQLLLKMDEMYEVMDSVPEAYLYTVFADSKNKANFEEKMTSYDKLEEEFKHLAKIGQSGKNSKEEKLLTNLHSAKKDYQKTTETMFLVFEKNHKIEKNDYDNFISKAERMHSSLHGLLDLRREELKRTGDEIDQMVRNIIMVIIIAALIVGVFAGSIALFMLRLISVPLVALQEAVNFIAGGDFSKRARIIGNNEIAKLAKNFNIMADNIQKAEENLRQTDEGLKAKKINLDKKVEELSDTEKAMLNILEDARMLEKQLAVEKLGVEQKVVEQTKEISEEKTRLFKFLEKIPEGVYVLDAKGKPIYANDEAKRLLGKGIMDVRLDDLSKIYSAYVAGTDKIYPWEQNPIVLALSGKIATVRDMEIKNDNKITPLEISGAPIFDDNGSVSYAIASFKDISEEKIIERSKDEFFSIASHELRTPLTAIRGNTSLIKQYYQDKIQDKDLNEMIDDIHESSVRLIGIVNDFLNVSRLEQGKMEFKLENFDIVELLKKKIIESKNLIDGKSLTILFDLSANPIPQVYADKDRLSEVILNLLGNAVKYSEKGTIEVKISTENNFVKVIVSDKGRGVSKEQQNLLFRKFQQAGESLLTRDTSKGTGLGLYISRLMIEQMGGKIQLESSEENKGSAFSFVVPVAK